MRAFGLSLIFAFFCHADSWQIQFFHDEDKSELTLTALQFPSVQRGLASGILDEAGKITPVVMVTSDAGTTWSTVRVREPGRALFCLDETACWMVTNKGVWFSTETGRNWTKIRKEDNLLGVRFVTREHGWAFGAQKKVIETKDGGKTWAPVPEVDSLNISRERTVFHAMTFLNEKDGILAGRSEPVAPQLDVPLWMDTEPELRKERPSLTVLMETKDGGKTWKETATSMFGRLARFSRPDPAGSVLGLVEFDRFFQYASEVFRYDIGSGKLIRAFRSSEIAITDIGLTPGGRGVAVGFQPPGKLARTPVPGRVRIFESDDLTKWREVPVDYRAVARRVYLSAPDGDNMWTATDTGMILRLVRNRSAGAERQISR